MQYTKQSHVTLKQLFATKARVAQGFFFKMKEGNFSNKKPEAPVKKKKKKEVVSYGLATLCKN